MGCDIHFYVERKIDGKWVQQFKNVPDPGPWKHNSKYWYTERNYILFGLLAGVRCDDITPLSPPRGIPDDLSDDLLIEYNEIGISDHSHSYYLLSELLKYKNDYTIMTGYVNIKNYLKYKKEGSPYDWSDYIPYMCVEIPNDKMERICNNLLSFLDDTKFITEIIWNFPNLKISEDFWNCLDVIKQLDPNTENIRCVFWFDN